jgi:hypothetical protein
LKLLTIYKTTRIAFILFEVFVFLYCQCSIIWFCFKVVSVPLHCGSGSRYALDGGADTETTNNVIAPINSLQYKFTSSGMDDIATKFIDGILYIFKPILEPVFVNYSNDL